MIRRFFLSSVAVAVAALMPTWALGSDKEVAQEIATAITQSGQLKDYRLGVQFENGAAVLMGRVASEQQAEAAVAIARQQPGVDEVINQLEIQPSAIRDFEVTPTGGSSRRVASRDELAFGAREEQQEVAAPEVPQLRQAAVQQAVAPARPSHPGRQVQRTSHAQMQTGMVRSGAPIPVGMPSNNAPQRVAYDQPNMPCNAWPSYASYPNYGAVTYPNQYSASAWPYIGPFYPYPQVPLGWRRVTMEWKDGWWWLDFDDRVCYFRRGQ